MNPTDDSRRSREEQFDRLEEAGRARLDRTLKKFDPEADERDESAVPQGLANRTCRNIWDKIDHPNRISPSSVSMVSSGPSSGAPIIPKTPRILRTTKRGTPFVIKVVTPYEETAPVHPSRSFPTETEPVVQEPVIAEPAAAEPIVTEPVIADPLTAEPVIPIPTIPETSLPKPIFPEPILPESIQSEPVLRRALLPKSPLPKPVVIEPAALEPVLREPVIPESAVLEPAAQKPISTEPAAQKPVIAEPVVKKPVIAEPVAQKPVIAEPVAQKPVIAEPVAQKPVIAEPVVKKPVIAEPVVKKPVIAEPVAQKPVIAEPIAKQPVIAEPIAKKPVIAEPAVQKPVRPKPLSPAQTFAGLSIEELKKRFAEQEARPHHRRRRFKSPLINGEIREEAKDEYYWEILPPESGTPSASGTGSSGSGSGSAVSGQPFDSGIPGIVTQIGHSTIRSAQTVARWIERRPAPNREKTRRSRSAQSQNPNQKKKDRRVDMFISIIAGVMIAVTIVYPTLRLFGRELAIVIAKSTVRSIGQNVEINATHTTLDLFPLWSEQVLHPRSQEIQLNGQDGGSGSAGSGIAGSGIAGPNVIDSDAAGPGAVPTSFNEPIPGTP